MSRLATVVFLTLLAASAPGFALEQNLQPAEPGLTRRLQEAAHRRVEALTRPGGPKVDIRLGEPTLRVFTNDLYHPATTRSGRYAEPRTPFSDASYRARIDVRVTLRGEDGKLLAERSFVGKASKHVRFPPPHAYRSFDSVWDVGRRHVGCSYYPEAEQMLRKAIHDALDEEALLWIASAATAQP
ncbi:MAG: hypothetical protein HY816_04005 [Candidatus Wallbacteria bacterium]|nr:hypothetical protein [Candidatus Wallbacteria bacterium]